MITRLVEPHLQNMMGTLMGPFTGFGAMPGMTSPMSGPAGSEQNGQQPNPTSTGGVEQASKDEIEEAFDD
jgi:hypothetical protein